jgi:AcrR family transcriptional regulator
MEVKRSSRRPRNSLTRELILDAAEQQAQDGFDAVTVRAVAVRLSAAPMALYRHFKTKEELVEALLDRVLGRFDAKPPSGHWQTDLREFARGHRRLLERHQWALAPLFSHPNPGPNATAIGEHALGILRSAGLDADQAVAIFSGLLALNYGWASFASARSANPDYARGVVDAIASLPPDAYPHTAALARELADYASERHYDLVLARLLPGIAQP